LHAFMMYDKEYSRIMNDMASPINKLILQFAQLFPLGLTHHNEQ
jgi:hypothetical protein